MCASTIVCSASRRNIDRTSRCSAALRWCSKARPISTSRRSNPCRSEEHTSELQSLMRISYAVFCLKKKTKLNKQSNKYDMKEQYIVQRTNAETNKNNITKNIKTHNT